MPRGFLAILLILLLLVAGGAWYLSSSVKEVPTRPIEIDVASDSAPR